LLEGKHGNAHRREAGSARWRWSRARAAVPMEKPAKIVARPKIVIIGDPAVGKTSLTQMFHSNGQRFPKAYTMTCGVDFSVKAVTVPGTHEAIEFHCFDVGGQDIFEETFGSYCEGAKAVVLVYDVTRGHTLEACGNWYAKLLEVLNVDGLPGALVANKVDLRERTAVNRQQGQQMAGSMHLSYFETSALDGHATDEPFIELAKAFASGGMAS